MFTDAELLKRYAEGRSESAFTELVERHVNLVYSAAWRESQGDSAMAQDITQAVFVEAARKSGQLARHKAFAGWLYTSVRFTAANLRRSEQRRERREQEAHAMSQIDFPSADDAAWQQLRPVIDDAMHDLNETDRAVVALRFLEGRSFKEVGDALSLNENTARMRADRALDKLRLSLNKRGVASSSTALAGALAIGALATAPSGMAATVTAAAVAAGSVAATPALTLTFLKIMSMSKLQIAVIGAVVAAGIAVPVWQQTRLNRVVSEKEQLETQVQQIDSLRQELASLHQLKVDHAELERLRGLQTEVARLRATAHSGREAQVEAAQLKSELERQKATAKADADSNNVASPMTGMMKGYMEQMMVARLNQMKQKLNLTSEQEQAIRGILVSQVDQQAEAAQKMFSGKATREEIAATQKSTNQDPEKQIQALLTPEQQPLYTQFKQAEATSNARLAANAEMLQMQTSLGLSQEQQDKVYGVLYDQYAKQLSGKQTDPAADAATASTDPTEMMQKQFEQKLKSLESVLTAEQLDTYRQFQESQLKMIQGLLPKSANARSTSQDAASSGPTTP